MRLELRRNGELVNVVEAELEWAREAYPDCEIIEAPLPVMAPPTAPPVTPSDEERRHKLSKYQFRRRFTLDELVKFDNPELFIADMTPQQRAIARTLMRSFDAASEIDLLDDQLRYGIGMMVQWGLLSQERAEEILNPSWNPAG